MRRIGVMSRVKFRHCLREHLALTVLSCLLISACSLPPKPRLINKQIEPERPQKDRPAGSRENNRERQAPAPPRASIFTEQKSAVVKPAAGVKIASDLTREKNFNERLLAALGVFLSAPYELGGVTPNGVDCSGLVQSVFAEAYGLELPHNAASQIRLGASIAENDLRLGDLVFFATRPRRGHDISHVGIYLTNRRFAHASTKAGVIVSSLAEAYWRRRYAGARRLIEQP